MGAYLPLLMSVTPGQCDTRPTVTFSAARHRQLLAGTKLYCLVTEARMSSITEWEMFITAQGCRFRNDLYCVEWDVKLYYTILLVSEMTYTVSSGTLNSTIPYHQQLAQGCTRQQGGQDAKLRPVDCKSSIQTHPPQSHTLLYGVILIMSLGCVSTAI